MTVDQSTDTTFAGAITGTGGLGKSGVGNLTLTGANDYSGGTDVIGGTLTGTTTSLQGVILNDADVVFDQTTNGTYAGAMPARAASPKRARESPVSPEPIPTREQLRSTPARWL